MPVICEDFAVVALPAGRRSGKLRCAMRRQHSHADAQLQLSFEAEHLLKVVGEVCRVVLLVEVQKGTYVEN